MDSVSRTIQGERRYLMADPVRQARDDLANWLIDFKLNHIANVQDDPSLAVILQYHRVLGKQYQFGKICPRFSGNPHPE